MDYQYIGFEVASGAARLTFKRPPLNVLNIAMMREINLALDGLDPATAKALVIAAEGKAFSAGVDVAEHTADKVGEMIEVFHGMFRRLDRLDVPTLAIVQGAALGGGCEVAAVLRLDPRFGKCQVRPARNQGGRVSADCCRDTSPPSLSRKSAGAVTDRRDD